MDKKIIVGKIISAFGIKGEIKIISYCQNPADIEQYPLFNQKDEKLKLKISNKNKTVIGSTASGDAVLIAKIDNVNDRNLAENLRGDILYCNRDDFKELASDEFYYEDLIGLKVIDKDSKEIGTVINVVDYGAGGMIEIEFLDIAQIQKVATKSSKEANKKIDNSMNFAFKNEFFPEINLKEGFIRANLPEIVEI
jgi:16S rRNA processing protein RimM